MRVIDNVLRTFHSIKQFVHQGVEQHRLFWTYYTEIRLELK
jgi:hypothetical protein